MSNNLILWPVIGLVILTFAVLLLIPLFRISALKTGNVSIKAFRYGDDGTPPNKTRLVNRNYMNLLEIPILFYLVCICFYITNTVTELSLTLAWAYLGFRLAHSMIHILYNNVLHRFQAFVLSNVVLMALWVSFIVELLQQ